MGFSAISERELLERWERWEGGMDGAMKKWCMLEHVGEVNEMLKGYEDLWTFFDVFIQVPFSSLSPFVLASPPASLHLQFLPLTN